MQLTPRYGGDPIITLDGEPAAIGEPVIRQRRRLADALATLTADQWAHPSRCEGWSNRDVVTHERGPGPPARLARPTGARGHRVVRRRPQGHLRPATGLTGESGT